MSENSLLVLNSNDQSVAADNIEDDALVIQQAHRTFDHLKSSEIVGYDPEELNHYTARRYIAFFESYQDYTSSIQRKKEAAVRVSNAAENVFVEAFALGAYVTQQEDEQDVDVVEEKKQALTHLMLNAAKSVRRIGWEDNPENDLITRGTKRRLDTPELLNEYRGNQAFDKLSALAELGLQQGARSTSNPFVNQLNG